MTTARKTTQTAVRLRDTSRRFLSPKLRWWQKVAAALLRKVVR